MWLCREKAPVASRIFRSSVLCTRFFASCIILHNLHNMHNFLNILGPILSRADYVNDVHLQSKIFKQNSHNFSISWDCLYDLDINWVILHNLDISQRKGPIIFINFFVFINLRVRFLWWTGPLKTICSIVLDCF